jgi:adenosylhomocysteine nucleosidase
MAEPKVTRVGLLAPMEHELAPLVRLLGLEPDGAFHRGRAGDVEVVALLTTMGMAAAADATRRLLDDGVDWVIVVGIAGGVDQETVTIGDLVVPEAVVDRATGTSYRPAPLGDVAAAGTISCGDDLIVDPARLAELHAEGILAVDMETAAVAAVCEAAGCPWSVFRSISDYAGEGLIDEELFGMSRPDGTADDEAVTKYLEAHPEKLDDLMRLAQDMTVATEAAAEAAVRSLSNL